MPQDTGIDGRRPLIIMFEEFFNGHFRVGSLIGLTQMLRPKSTIIKVLFIMSLMGSLAAFKIIGAFLEPILARWPASD